MGNSPIRIPLRLVISLSMRFAILIVLFSVPLFSQNRGLEPLSLGSGKSTDARITADSASLRARPSDNSLAAKLALDYLQKMRETVNFDYVNLAAKLVEGILERDPGNYEALRLRTEIDMERHEFARVAEASLEMTRFAPQDPGAWGSLGDSSMELGEYKRAGEAYQRMLALRPELASYNRVAWHRWVTGDAAGAIAMMQAAIAGGSHAPENVAWCLADLGGMYWKIGKAEEAASAYRRALELFPGYYAAWAGLGRMASADGDVKTAIGDYLKAQATVPMPEYAEALEDLYGRAGDAARARQQRELMDAIEITMRASGEKTNRNVVLLFADQNRNLDRAAELIGNEIVLRPDVYTHDALAWVLLRQGKFQEAQRASAVALSLGTPEPLFHFHAGMILDALGKREEAAREFDAALALNPRWDFHQSELARQKARPSLIRDVMNTAVSIPRNQ
jgi:tetratricopeptide (TPR) repeat protein